MNRLIATTLLVTGLYLSSNSQKIQKPECHDKDWEKTPPSFTTTESEDKKDVVVLSLKKTIELVSEKDDAYEYYFTHSFKKVNTDAGIEESNKIYVFESPTRKLITNKMRVINPDGTIIELNSNDINEGVDEQNKQKYKYYAVRGLTKGSIIEEFQIMKTDAKLSGKIVNIQNDDFQKNIDFQIILPDYLTYEVKSYNGLPNLTKDDTSYKEKLAYKLFIDSIDELESEKYNNYAANLKCVAYKLTGNGTNQNLNSFNTVAENINKFLNLPIDNKSSKALDKLMEQIKFKEDASLSDSIFTIEQKVKNEFVFVENLQRESSTLSAIIQDKKANEQDFMYLIYNLFKAYHIKAEPVITNSRFDFPFDPKFENMNQLENYLIHFPGTKKFLSPGSIETRYPWFPARYGNNYGLFIKQVNVGGNEVVMKDLKKIELFPHYERDSLDIVIDFRESVSNPSIQLLSSSFGAAAQTNQFLFEYLDDNQKKEMVDGYIKSYTGESETKSEYQNVGKENMGVKPYIVKTSFQSNKILEKNGNTYLVKIGEIIGPQSELYQEKPRATSIDMPNPHTYIRKLKVIIPDDYTYNNLEDLNINHELKINDKEESGFHSSYVLNGNELSIDILEFYAKHYFPITSYNEFKNVINAAADFNKVKIVLKKKE